MAKQLTVKNLFNGNTLQYAQRVYVDRGRITAIETIEEELTSYDYENLAPAFADIHINGGQRLHFTQNPSVESVLDIAEASHQTGCFYTLPTLITSSTENIYRGIDAVREFQQKYPDKGVLGMHLEGPFISTQKRGAHLTKYIRRPSIPELQALIDYGKDVLKMITVAPEQLEEDALQLLLDSGIRVSAGHSNATYAQTMDFFAKGGDLITHFYNAMSGFTHRAPGMVGAILEKNNVHVPIILDGVHCDFGAARLAYKSAKEKMFLITDALFLGKQVTRFQWEEFDATLQGDRYVNNEGNLAGGAIDMGTAIRNAVKEVGVPLEEAIAMASVRPAKALHLETNIGSIAIGFEAIFTNFDASLHHFEIVKP